MPGAGVSGPLASDPMTAPLPFAATATRFAVGDDDFMLDGRAHRILSGAIHFFRVHPDQWRDRIRKAKQMGLNTVETDVPWNLHEPTPGAWIADGALDLGRFLDDVAAEGVDAVLRATRDAAYATFWEHAVGRLAPGMRADFVVLDRDPFTDDVALETLLETRVTTTVVEGWVAFRA
jgi:imidazolonepropionase-like amidohydrolase